MREARKLAEQALPESELSSPQIALLLELNSGVLEQNMLAKNKAYGHGEGVKIRTKEEAAVFRMSCNALDAYFAR